MWSVNRIYQQIVLLSERPASRFSYWQPDKCEYSDAGPVWTDSAFLTRAIKSFYYEQTYLITRRKAELGSVMRSLVTFPEVTIYNIFLFCSLFLSCRCSFLGFFYFLFLFMFLFLNRILHPTLSFTPSIDLNIIN